MTTTESWLGKNPLRRWRERDPDATVTQTDAARQLGCSPSSIRMWEQGGAEPQHRYFERIAELLGVEEHKLRQRWGKWYREGVREKPRAEVA